MVNTPLMLLAHQPLGVTIYSITLEIFRITKSDELHQETTPGEMVKVASIALTLMAHQPLGVTIYSLTLEILRNNKS